MSSRSSNTQRWVVGVGCTLAVAAGLGVLIWRRERDAQIRRKARLLLKKKDGVNIGSIFGMDVGGTLAKIVYFEANHINGNEGESAGGWFI